MSIFLRYMFNIVRPFFIAVLIFLLLPTGVFATQPATYQTLHQLYHESWTSRDGAPANIEHVLEGPDGFLWIATDEGMYRFDGSSFERLPLSLPPNHPYLLARTRDGAMWIFWLYGSLSRIKNGLVVNVTRVDGLQDTQLSGVVQRKDGSYWIAGRAGLQVLTETESGGLKVDPGVRALHATTMSEDTQGNVWLTTPDLLEVKPADQPDFVPISIAGFFCQASHAPGVLCAQLAKDGPVVHWQWQEGHAIQNAPLDGVTARAFWAPGDGTIWVGANQGLVRKRLSEVGSSAPASAAAETYAKIDGLSDDSPFEILSDREGSVWVITSKGLDRFRNTPFSAIDMRKPIPVVLAHGRPNEQNIVATDRLIDITTGTPVSISEQFENGDWARTLLRADDDSLWIGTGTGRLYQYSKNHLMLMPLHSLLGNDPILAVAEDATHNLWISIGNNKGVYKRDDNSWTKASGVGGLPLDSAPNIVRDADGDLWFAYRDGRIAHLAAGKARVFNAADGLNVGSVRSFADRGSEMWVGGETGVAVLQGQHFRALRTDRPRMRGVAGLAFAVDGSLWINSADGVVRVDKGQLTIDRLSANQPAETQLFDFHDGVQGVPFPLYVDSVRPDAKGRLYVATRELLQWIDPLAIQQNKLVPPVWIRAVTVDGHTERYPTSSITLNPNVESMEIDFTAPSLLVPDRVSFRYKLEGYDKDWISSGSRRQAFYSKLPPANYRFQVVASNDSGVWNTSGASVNLKVPPTFVQTYTFKLLSAAVLAAAAWLFYRLRLMQISAQLRSRMYARLAEREQIARNLHDTFFQAVTGLFLTINSVTKTMSKDDPARAVVEEALLRSDKVMAEGRELVLDLRGGHSRGQTLHAMLTEVGTELSQPTACRFSLIVTGDVRELRPLSADEVYWLGREAISNSFRHSEAKLVEVEVEYGAAQLRVRIRDDGIGIDENILEQGQRYNHWGLPGMRERAKTIGARLDIWSGRNAGTEIEVSVPAGLAYREMTASTLTRLARILKVLRIRHET